GVILHQRIRAGRRRGGQRRAFVVAGAFLLEVAARSAAAEDLRELGQPMPVHGLPSAAQATAAPGRGRGRAGGRVAAPGGPARGKGRSRGGAGADTSMVHLKTARAGAPGLRGGWAGADDRRTGMVLPSTRELWKESLP